MKFERKQIELALQSITLPDTDIVGIVSVTDSNNTDPW